MSAAAESKQQSFKHGSPSPRGMGMENILLLTDSYKVSHHVQYPPNTTTIYSYFEPRGGRHKDICFFGLQYFIKRYLTGVVVTEDKIAEAKELYTMHFGPGTNVFNEAGWQYILQEHGGVLPVRIRAVPEGTCLPYKNCCMTVENTDPKCYWLVNFLETLLVQVWYPMTVATNCREQKKTLLHYLQKTGDPSPMSVGFKLHDFGFRGVSSVESAGIGDAAHLTQFLGTDTIAGIVVARDYYGEKCAGFSIPASEHSTMTSWGKETSGAHSAGGELAAMANMLEQYKTGLVAIVSDSYNIWEAVTEKYGKELKETIMSREGTVVIRPDSGPPALVDCELLHKLGQAFSMEKNAKGYKELPPQVRVIQGDGIDHESLATICALLEEQGWSMNNIAFGSGGGLLQKLNRDTQKVAFKCSYAQVDGKDIDVCKTPIHAPGKKSKAGRMTVNRRNGTIVTLCGELREESDDIMETVFENGSIVREYSWDEIKTNSTIDMSTYAEWGPAVEARSQALLQAYKSSEKYSADCETMVAADSNYTALY